MAWRTVLLYLLGLAPYAAPPVALPAPAPWVAWVRTAICGVVMASLWLARSRARRPYPWLARAAGVALVTMPFLAAAMPASHQPLAAGAWLSVPIVWSVVAAAAAGPGATWLGVERVQGRLRLAILVGAAGLASLVAAWPRIGSREALLRSAAATAGGRGPEDAVVALAADRASHGDHKGALELLKDCMAQRPWSCACADGAAGEQIDLDHYPEAIRTLDDTPSCPGSARRTALRAEVLVGSGAAGEGAKQAEAALRMDPDDAHAAFARAWAASTLNDPTTARPFAERAVERGRGTPARLLLGHLLLAGRDYGRAREVLEAILRDEPENPRATYALALLDEKIGRYNDAREGYLKVLRLDPMYADARYELAVMTYGAGAALESKHHVDVFVVNYPADPRGNELRRMLSTPPARPAMSFGQ